MGKKRKQAMSSAEAQIGNVVGIDPHKHTLSAAVVDQRGGLLGCRHFPVSAKGHQALETWVLSLGPVLRWGIEGASGLGRHTALYLLTRAQDVRDVCPNRTAERARNRRQGKSDTLDAERIARELLAHPDLPLAFKRSQQAARPDQVVELLGLWHQARRSMVKSQQHLLNEAEDMLQAMPEAIRDRLPASKAVWPRLRALTTLSDEMSGEDWDAPTALRLRLLGEHARALSELEQREEEICCEMAKLVKQTGSTLDQLCGISTRSAAELLVEVGDPCRFTDGGFARFNGTAPLPASSAEGDDEPVRHRLNRGGNRRVNAVLHRMAVTQLRCEPRAQAIFNEARRNGHTKKEAMRVLKRQLSNVVHRRMLSDLQSRSDMAAAA